MIPVADSGDLPAAVLVDIDDEKSGTYYVHAVAPVATLDGRLETLAAHRYENAPASDHSWIIYHPWFGP